MDLRHAEEPLLIGRKLMCPWCGTWESLETYIVLQIPPLFSRQCTVIYKHGGPNGCKSLFALAEDQ